MSSPPGNFAPGKRLGHYRIGGEHPVTDEHGNFRISYEDYSLALVDEIETPNHRPVSDLATHPCCIRSGAAVSPAAEARFESPVGS